MSVLSKDSRDRAAGPSADTLWQIMKEVLGAQKFAQECDLDNFGVPRDTHGKMPLSWANMHDIVKGLDKVMQRQNSAVYRLEDEVRSLQRELTLAIGAIYLLVKDAPVDQVVGSEQSLAVRFLQKSQDALEKVREEIFDSLAHVVGEEAARKATDTAFEAALREHLGG